MLAIREEELNMVNGGIGFAGLFGGPKFSEGDLVISKSEPVIGVGVVVGKEYNEGWHYALKLDRGMFYTTEDDLEYAITK